MKCDRVRAVAGVQLQALNSKLSFLEWLLSQVARADVVGGLARAVAADRRMPRMGNAMDVKRRLHAVHAEYEVFLALEAAAEE